MSDITNLDDFKIAKEAGEAIDKVAELSKQLDNSNLTDEEKSKMLDKINEELKKIVEQILIED